METPVLATDELETEENQEPVPCEAPFAWELRVFLVSMFWVLPGLMFGILLRLCIPAGGPVEIWLIGGGIVGAIAGGVLEADHFTFS